MEWVIVRWKDDKYVKVYKTYFKVFENAERKRVALQRRTKEHLFLKQHPVCVVVNNQHSFSRETAHQKRLKERRKPVQLDRADFKRLSGFNLLRIRTHPDLVLVGDMMPDDLKAFNNGGIDDYWESAQWSNGRVLVSWKADEVGISSYYENQHGDRETEHTGGPMVFHHFEDKRDVRR